jgi:DNA-binding transcriptional ArsR family regulator
LIRIHLTAEDVARIRIDGAADFGLELALAGRALANGLPPRRLAVWRRGVADRWNPDLTKLLDLYAPTMLPHFFEGAAYRSTSPDAATVGDDAYMAGHLSRLAVVRELTPFTRALADGRASAYETLGRGVTAFQAAAVDPYRRAIASAVAVSAAQAGARAAASGTGAMLSTLHPGVRWDGATLTLATNYEADVELCARALILRPTVLGTRIIFGADEDPNTITLSFPATDRTLVPDPPLRTPNPALAALLGSTRAAALAAIAATPAVTTGGLAAVLGVSAAAASRHATTLRDAGLITTFRNGEAVHHHPTRLGSELVAEAGPSVQL